jgi:hypothetical protein
MCWLNAIKRILVIFRAKNYIDKGTSHSVNLEKGVSIFGDQNPISDSQLGIVTQSAIRYFQDDTEDIFIHKRIRAGKLHAIFHTL